MDIELNRLVCMAEESSSEDGIALAEAEELYRRLPQIGELLRGENLREMLREYGRETVLECARGVLGQIREQIRSGDETRGVIEFRIEQLPNEMREALELQMRPSLRRVINATGVLLQTNMGRAPLSEAAIRSITEVARGYCNLEIDLATGERSRRGAGVERLILNVLVSRRNSTQEAMAGRAALVVNNCAAAMFLALNSLADGGEVIVSRGELVEIGGGFRIPEILRKSGAVLREVGTTNRTRARDYAEAITAQTRLILRVHRSNFRMEGFTERPEMGELVALGVPVFEDQGTGCVVRLDEYGIAEESSLVESVASGAALVAASGDKLMGGPQCGILVGAEDLVRKIRENPLYRTYRVDKLTYAALEATLLAYRSGRPESLPALAMMAMPLDVIEQRCERLVEALHLLGVDAEVVPVRSVAGGGTTPGASLPSFAVALVHGGRSEAALAERLRGFEPPVVPRIHEGRVLLDLRTVAPEDDAVLLRLLGRAMCDGGDADDLDGVEAGT